MTSTELCRVLNMVFYDNNSFCTIIDETIDTLSAIRLSLNATKSQSLKRSVVASYFTEGPFRFAYVDNLNFTTISSEKENLAVKDVIDFYNIRHLVVDEKLTIYIRKEHVQELEVPPDPNELFREKVTLIYVCSQSRLEKILVLKLQPKPSMTILNTRGCEEFKISPKDFSFSQVNNTEIEFTSKSEINANSFFLELPNQERRNVCFENLQNILRQIEQAPPAKLTGLSRHYYIRKTNRYGFKQKRIIWFNHDECTFNICTLEHKNQKSFRIKDIKKFIKKGKSSAMTIAFYEEVNAKTLNLVFFNDMELIEFLDLAQKLHQSLRETKFQSKATVIFSQEVSNIKQVRKYTWLSKNITNATSEKNSTENFTYNVLQVGIVSTEKRFLSFSRSPSQVVLLNRYDKLIRNMDISHLSLNPYFHDPLRLELIYNNSSNFFIFPSAYAKYHFVSQVYMEKFPNSIFPSSEVRKKPLNVYTCTWNFGQKAKPNQETLHKFLSNSSGHEIAAISFQECKKTKLNSWLKAINQYYEQQDKLLVSYISMWEMFLVVYADISLIPSLYDIKTYSKATGVAGIIGNKGGLLISFRLEDTSFCFLSCHLAARPNRILIRNQNAKDLLSFRPGNADVEFQIEFDYTFWLGDFNYRIDENYYTTIDIINQKNYEVLWAKDQLICQSITNKMYSTFNEGLLEFKPTYRKFPWTDEWSNKKEQTPSWTDRILYKAHMKIDIKNYTSIDDCYGSDHRPVYASFGVEVKSWYIPEIFPPLNDEVRLGVIEFQKLVVDYNEETNATYGMVSFISPYLETHPKSSQVALGSDGRAEFGGNSLPVLSFIFANGDFLKTARIVVVFWLSVVDGETYVVGNCSLPLYSVIEFISSSYSVNEKMTFSTNRSVEFEKNLEYNSHVVGKFQGCWTYNICSKSEQYRS